MTGASIDYGSRARLGVLLPSGNTAVEPQFAALSPAGLACHFTRLKLVGSTTEELLAMTQGVEAAAGLLADARVGLIAFHCTAVSTWAPELEADVLRRISSSSGIPAVATSQALCEALLALRARRIVMLSPYVQHIADREEQYLRAKGFDVLGSCNLGVSTPREMLEVSPEKWLSLLLRERHAAADAYLISCTAIRAAEVVEEAERALGRPVITSNSAMLWFASRKLGIGDNVLGWGRLGGMQPEAPND